MIGRPDFTLNEPVLAAMKEQYVKNCPDCKYEIVDIRATEWQSKIPSTVVAASKANPDLDYIIPFSDPASENVSLSWTGHAFVDQILRVLDGEKQAPGIANGMRCFDSCNVDEAGNRATPGKGFGDSYLTGYKKLWGVGG